MSTADETSANLAHIVYFTLTDRSTEARDALIAACREHLSGHEGEVYFSVGHLAEQYQRPVNDRDFDVALHVVFDSVKAHDAYQVAPRHLKFIEQNKPTWAKVRVFDSIIGA
ncbi:Dabb family protein [Isosphaeraceae bacterium EP7]